MSEIEISLDQISRKKTQFTRQVDLESSVSCDSNKKRVGIKTMGCKVNAYESELISETLKGNDWRPVSSSDVADLYIINTCTVTQEADRQARREVRKVIRQNPNAMVVVTGCYAQMDSESCANIPGVDLVLGNNRKLDIHEFLPDLEKGNLPKILVGDLDEHVSLPSELLTGYEAQTRAFIQIQQGCDQGCTFCIIHRARGPSRSLAPTLIRRQVEHLAINGYPEIVICGVDLGSYGEDFPVIEKPYRLVDLLSDLLSIDVPENPDFRIRLSSIDPVHITNDLVELMSADKRICPHIHLSLQSGSTLILKRMKRRYTREDVYHRIQQLREKIPDLVMSADVMVGFPTETEEHFDQTKKALIDLDIAFPHIFSYSDRTGTPAARIPNIKHVPPAVKKKRSNDLRIVANQLQNQLHASQVNNVVWVLPEKRLKKSLKARSEHYLTVMIDVNDATSIPLGKWIKVRYIGVENQHMLAEIVI